MITTLNNFVNEAVGTWMPKIIEYLTKNPGSTYYDVLKGFNTKDRTSMAASIYNNLSKGVKAGKLYRTKEGASFKYFVGVSTNNNKDFNPNTPNKEWEPVGFDPYKNTGKPIKPTVKTKSTKIDKAKLLEDIKNDFNSFLRYNHGDIEVYENTVTKEFRDLGNWVHNEEDAYYREEDGDMDWREDDDSMIWAPGEYKRFMQQFKDWANGYYWFNMVDLDIQTSEKNWCEFTITLKQHIVTEKINIINESINEWEFNSVINDPEIYGINEYLKVSKDVDIDTGKPSVYVTYSIDPSFRKYGLDSINITIKKVVASIEWEAYADELSDEDKQGLINAGGVYSKGNEWTDGTISGVIEFDGSDWEIKNEMKFREDGAISCDTVIIELDKKSIELG